MGESTFPVHDRILGIQASALTMLMNPTTLRRVYDNEQLVPRDQDALTLPEMLDKVQAEVWSEVGANAEGEANARKPRISSWRRSLQREHLDRLIDLTVPQIEISVVGEIQNSWLIGRGLKIEGQAVVVIPSIFGDGG